MSKHYDRIIRGSSMDLFKTVLSKRLRFRHQSLEKLSDQAAITLDLETDFAVRLDEMDPPNQKLAHIEVQYGKEKQMGRRMHEYHTVLFRFYNLPVVQLVVFLHDKKGKKSGRRCYSIKGKLKFHYDVLYLQDIPYRKLLASGNAEAVILAILGNFGKTPADEVVDQIIRRVQLLEKDSFIRSNIFWYLIVLSRIRKLNLIVEQKINAMSTLIQEILKDYPFSPDEPIVQAIGELKRAEGKAEGKAEGIAEGISEVVARFLRAGTLTPEKIAETMDMSVEEVLAIGRRFG